MCPETSDVKIDLSFLIQNLEMLAEKCNRDIQIKNFSNVYLYVREYNTILQVIKEEKLDIANYFRPINTQRNFFDSFFGNWDKFYLEVLSKVDHDSALLLLELKQLHASNGQEKKSDPITKLSDKSTEITVFIGHGGNTQWRDLKDHLQDKQKIKTIAFESGARAGLTTKEVLNGMVIGSSFALLVLTGEDVDKIGNLHARENVIHELGLFQARLGWNRAIVLLEDGVTEFSNIQGVNQIRFAKGHIQETFGDVIATINREFPRY